MKENDFIGQMVQETLSNSNYDSYEFSHDADSLCEIRVKVDQARGCYLIWSEKEHLEIPKNWGPFKNRISGEFILSKKEDNEHFLDMLSVFFQQDISTAKFVLDQTPFEFDRESAA
tara:strand:- start:395 stop:742 length:348 start_codon:yes stop_codon:yes gene_type:complete